jgi:eukaryotic-like serine/threonine-protein kinase
MTDQASDEKAIFFAAIEHPPGLARDAFVSDACSGLPELLNRVKKLLAVHDNGVGPLDSPPGGLEDCATLNQAAPAHVGMQIGRYKLLEQVGEGGMGVVYVAEQTEPVRRRVALKIIKPGMDTRQVIARFEAERQALAMMDHLNIARVLDAATTDAGRPYFVMELVRGLPITEYCDKARLSPRQRLGLFVEVCQAVQHAHQKGIIHRDLKPSNVMVTTSDGRPIVKVIDFGVAKAVGQQLTERTVYTALTQLVGTPLYMSPEQAELTSNDVDTRSDIYSLGVLLYELLTGQTPFDKETLAKVGLDEMRRIIREDEPLRPSRRFSTLNAQASSTISQHRSLDERQLSRVLRGELDWIVMKSLEKDRSRRYESASALAADIQRYLSDEPVLACPPTAMYRFQKFARKHKPALFTAASIAISLILGTTVSAWQAARATQAEAQATANEQKANANAAQAQEEAEEAATQRDEAQRQRDEAKALNDKLSATQTELRSTLYAAQMNLAHNAWETNSGGAERVQQLLNLHRPKPGETDLRGFEWHYLSRLSHAETLTFRGHSSSVMSVAFSPDGKRLVSAGGFLSKIWDAQTGKEFVDLKPAGLIPSPGIQTITFSPNGKLVAGVSGSSWIMVWDAQTGLPRRTISVGGLSFSGGGDEKRVAFSPDSERLVSGTYEGLVKVWNAETGEELVSIMGHTGAVRSVAFSPDGSRVVSAAGNNTVKMWDAVSGQELLSLKGSSAKFSPDGKSLVGRFGGKTRVWDAQTGNEIISFDGWLVVFSPDGKRLVGADAMTVKVWDAETGREVHRFNGHTEMIISMAISPDGKRIASASSDQTVKLWDLESIKKPFQLQAAGAEIYCMAVSPDGKRVAGGLANKTVKLWDIQTGQELMALQGHSDSINCVAFSPDGQRLASGSGIASEPDQPPGQVMMWDAQSGQELLSQKAGGRCVAFSADGNRLASGAWDGTVTIWDVRTGDVQIKFKVHTGGVDSVAFSPDGRRLASGCFHYFGRGERGGHLKVSDAHTGEQLWVHASTGSFSKFTSVAFSPDGKRLSTASWDKTLKVWDAETGQELRTLQGHTARAQAVTYSPDGRRLVSTAQDNSIKVWDPESGQELLTLKADSAGVAFSSNGQRLYSASPEGTVSIYDATPLPESP